VFLDVFLPLTDRMHLHSAFFEPQSIREQVNKQSPFHNSNSYYTTVTNHEHFLRNFVGARRMPFLDHGVYHNASEQINRVIVVLVVAANDSP
jgi:hypothetical protein